MVLEQLAFFFVSESRSGGCDEPMSAQIDLQHWFIKVIKVPQEADAFEYGLRVEGYVLP